MTPGYLVDKSALARWDEPTVAAVLEPALAAGLLWSCPPAELEVLYSCRYHGEYQAVREERADSYHSAPLEADVGAVAMELQEALARSGQLRAVGPIDLLIGAVAVRHELTVLHYDYDFELLAGADPRLRHRWVVPRDSVS